MKYMMRVVKNTRLKELVEKQETQEDNQNAKEADREEILMLSQRNIKRRMILNVRKYYQ